MVGNTSHAQNFRVQVAADGRQIRVHSGSCRGVEPRLAILRTKDNVNNNLTERLRHWRSMDLKSAEMNRAFSADICLGANSWGAAPGYLEPPPLALGCDLGEISIDAT